MVDSGMIWFDTTEVIVSYIYFLLPCLLLFIWEFIHTSKNMRMKWGSFLLIFCIAFVGVERIRNEFTNFVILNNRKEYALFYINDAIESGVPIEEIHQELDLYYKDRTRHNDPLALFRLGEHLRQKANAQRGID